MFPARVTLGVGATVVGMVLTAQAVPIGVVPTKLIVIDKLTAATKAKAVYVAKDAGATKGSGTDATDISVTFTVQYDGETGEWTTGGADFLVNKSTVAKFVNKDAPSAPTVIKVAAIKPAKLLKMVAKERGDGDVLDILAQGAPTGSVFSAYQVVNGAETNTHCSEFNGCSYKLIAGDTGAKLVCKGGVSDDACEAACDPTDAPANPALGLPAGKFVDCSNGTVFDTRTGLQWEQKNGAGDETPLPGTPDPGNLHDVDNLYVWAGCCDGDCNDLANLCQPNEAAAEACFAQAELGTEGCSQCATGACNTDPFGFGALTTVWDWINQVNAEFGDVGFAGHSDWRLPSEAGNEGSPVCDPVGCKTELQTILDCGFFPCINPSFGPTIQYGYWSATTGTILSGRAWDVFFNDGFVGAFDFKYFHLYVRAVR